jgi:hypothetical protein
MKTCFFIGHRDAPEALRPRLQTEVERQITEKGVMRFVVGRYGRFDAMAADAVRTAKQMYPAVRLELLLPYHPAERPVETPPGFDGTYYPFEKPVPSRVAIVRANQQMIRQCHSLIAYAVHPGNARTFVEQAQKRADAGVLDLVNLWEGRP